MCSGKIFWKAKGGIVTKTSLRNPPAILLVSNAGEVCTTTSCQALLPHLQASTWKGLSKHTITLQLPVTLCCFLTLSTLFQLQVPSFSSTFKMLVGFFGQGSWIFEGIWLFWFFVCLLVWFWFFFQK